MRLTDRQAILLARLAAAAERGGNNPWFLIVEAMGREPIALFTSNENVADVGEADLSELQAAGVVRMIGLNSKGKPKYAVTNEGFEFCRAMRKDDSESGPGEESKVQEAPRHSRPNPLRGQRAGPPGPLRVFLCHSSGDKPSVREIYDRLKTDGFQPWLDDEDLLPGHDWDLEIDKAVSQAHVVLAFLSNASVSKEGYVQKELKRALDVADEKPEGTIFVIPVRLEDCPVPERLKKWHWVDLFDQRGYQRLIRSLRQRSAQLGLPSEAGSNTASMALGENSSKESKLAPSPLVGVRIGDKMHSHDDGFRIRVLMTNYFDRPIKLDRFEFGWWLSDASDQIRTKVTELQQPLPVNAADQPFTIRLSDHEAWSDRRDIPDLRSLYALLYGRAKVYFVTQDGEQFAESPAFKVL